MIEVVIYIGDKTYKNLFDDGYTTYHDDGSKSTTHRNLLDDGYTTYHDDGSKSTTHRNLLDDGYTTYHDDGSKSTTYRNLLDDGFTTYHEDGSKSTMYQNLLGDGYTTYRTGGSGATLYSSSAYSSASRSFGYSSTYVVHPSLDISCIVVSIIAAVLVPLLCWLFTANSFVLPSVIFDVTFIISFIGAYTKKGKPYIWSWLFYMSATVMLMMMVNNRNFTTTSILSILIWLAPIGNAIIIGFIASLVDFEESYVFPVAPFIFLVIAWFCCIYKKRYLPIYEKCVTYEVIALIALGVITLVLGFLEARKQERRLNRNK